MQRQRVMQQAVPYAAGIFFLLLFVKLGFWQLDRAGQKEAMNQAFEDPGTYAWISSNINPPKFQALEVTGNYLNDRQFLIDNVVKFGRLGYYVISPLEYSRDEPLLLVNRGWLEKDPKSGAIPSIGIEKTETLIRGKAGSLPKVGIRPGEAFEGPLTWPRIGVWPTSEEIAAELGQDVLPFVLLLDSDRDEGFHRDWAPPQTGVSTHYGYAFQWFAMAATVLALLIWHGRRDFFARVAANDDDSVDPKP